MEKIKYEIMKDKEFIGKRFESYTVIKTITYDNGEIEHRYRTIFPSIDGNIDKMNLDDLYFPITITQEEFKQLPEEYDKAWMKGTLTKEMSEKMQELVLIMRANRRTAGGNC